MREIGGQPQCRIDIPLDRDSGERRRTQFLKACIRFHDPVTRRDKAAEERNAAAAMLPGSGTTHSPP